MLFRRLPVAISMLCLIALGLSSCLARRRMINRQGASSNSQQLLVAEASTLLGQIVKQYQVARNFSATVDMVPALGSAEKSRITEYKDVRAYILFRQPATIRIIGLYPVVRNKAFDMVSDGTDFKLYIPGRNRFL